MIISLISGGKSSNGNVLLVINTLFPIWSEMLDSVPWNALVIPRATLAVALMSEGRTKGIRAAMV